MFEALQIIKYPDLRLKKVSTPIEAFDENLAALSRRMLELMRMAEGVGLAAPQVGRNVRLFVMNATGKPEDDKVFVNPTLTDPAGEEEGEEGCLSLPGIRISVLRSRDMRIDAFDLQGKPISETAGGYIARIWQHEVDHLNGTLLLDKMGPVARLANRKAIKEMEEEYADAHPPKPKSTANRKTPSRR